MLAQVPPGMYTDFMRHAAQLAHHQMELAQAQLLPHVLLPGSLAMCVETTQPAPSVPAGALPSFEPYLRCASMLCHVVMGWLLLLLFGRGACLCRYMLCDSFLSALCTAVRTLGHPLGCVRHIGAHAVASQSQVAKSASLPGLLTPGLCAADFLPKWQAECDPAWQGDVDAGADLAVPGFFPY